MSGPRAVDCCSTEANNLDRMDLMAWTCFSGGADASTSDVMEPQMILVGEKGPHGIGVTSEKASIPLP